jgi:short-subunit dehydrogenase
VEIQDRVAIVTGASSGIGAAVAVELARRGAVVVAVARRQARLDDTVARCQRWSPTSLALVADVADRATCERIAGVAAVRGGGPVEILVNNAGISPPEQPLRHAADDVERVVGINFLAAVYLAGAVLPAMVERGRGSIVNVTSVSGYVPNPGEPAYGASKAALSRWSHGLAVDLASTGVHVGVLSPGPINTEIWDNTGTHYNGRLYAPELVARAVARMIEHEQTHRTVPRRFGAVGALYPIVGRPMRWGLRRFGQKTNHSGAPRRMRD